MSGPKATIRLILIHDNQNDAESLLGQLRDAGYSARSHFIAAEEEIEQVIHNQVWDLVYLKLQTDTVDAWECLQRIQQSGKDLPIIGLIDQYDSQLIERALSQNITDIAVTSMPTHLLHCSIREFNNLLQRREKRQNDILLNESQKRCQLLLDNSRDAIAYVHEGMHIYANDSYLQLFSYDDLDELACIPLMDMIHSDQHEALKETLKSPMTQDQVLSCQAVDAKDQSFDVNMTFSAATYEGENCLQVIIRPPSENNSELEEKIKAISSQDLVTGLFNRSRFNDELNSLYQHCIEENHSREILYLSINKFSELKGTVGIAGTDLILKDVADMIVKLTPDNVTAARYRDDVFTVIFPEQPLKLVKGYANAICQAVNQHLFEVDGKTLHLTAAVGISSVDERLQQATDALTHAHQANSKTSEEQPVNYYDYSDANNLNDDSLLAQIEHAIEHNHFDLLFQPVVNLHGSGHEHYEVTFTLPDSERGHIGAAELIEATLDTKVTSKLDRWFVEQAINKLAEHRAKGNQTVFFIPVSFESIQDATFLPWVNMVLKQAHLPGDAITFQISEETAHTYLKAAKAFSNGLNLLKANLAITEYGKLDTGLSISKHLSISYVSLHADFSERLAEDPEAQQTLTELVTDIHNHEVSTIIPNIHSAAALTALWQAGVNYIQGDYLQAASTELNYNFNSDEEM